jgi:hypothetical protein
MRAVSAPANPGGESMTQTKPRSGMSHPPHTGDKAGFWAFMLAMSVFPIIIVLLYVFNT